MNRYAVIVEIEAETPRDAQKLLEDKDFKVVDVDLEESDIDLEDDEDEDDDTDDSDDE